VNDFVQEVPKLVELFCCLWVNKSGVSQQLNDGQFYSAKIDWKKKGFLLKANLICYFVDFSAMLLFFELFTALFLMKAKKGGEGLRGRLRNSG